MKYIIFNVIPDCNFNTFPGLYSWIGHRKDFENTFKVKIDGSY